ncbi:MAG: DUF2238 domain-containing protein [Patescibacteria group bacterium]
MQKLPQILFLSYIALFIALGIAPYSREVWYAENIPIVGIAIILFILYINGVRFSNASYIFMSALLFLHTIGGYYTFGRVPFDFVTNFFGFERNHYDRIAHVTVGFYAYPLIEYMEARGIITKRWVNYVLGLSFIMAIAAGYEILEWIFAITSDPSAGIAFLGSQGDVWDAQKDMLADTMGAGGAIFFYHIFQRIRLK